MFESYLHSVHNVHDSVVLGVSSGFEKKTVLFWSL